MNNCYFIVYDFETDGTDPNECAPVELAAVPIEPRSLTILEEQAFEITIKPPDIDEDTYYENHESTIMWHASNHNMQPREIVARWKDGVDQGVAWSQFVDYCNKFKLEKTPGQWKVDPIAAGYNIINFDNKICDRLADQHKTKLPFSSVNKLDLYDFLWTWFENLREPHNMKMDTFRDFFSMPQNGIAHEAITDVLDTAKIIVRFLSFQRKQASVKKFKGSFKQ